MYVMVQSKLFVSGPLETVHLQMLIAPQHTQL